MGTVLVTLGLIGAWYGLPVADTIAAIGVAGLLSYTSFTVGRRALGMLLDRIDPRLSVAVLTRIEAMPETVEVAKLRIRRLPEHHVVDVTLVARLTGLSDIARIEADLLARIAPVLGKTDLSLALRPL